MKSAEKDYLGLFDEDDDTDEEDQADADVDEGWQDALDSQGREESKFTKRTRFCELRSHTCLFVDHTMAVSNRFFSL